MRGGGTPFRAKDPAMELFMGSAEDQQNKFRFCKKERRFDRERYELPTTVMNIATRNHQMLVKTGNSASRLHFAILHSSEQKEKCRALLMNT